MEPIEVEPYNQPTKKLNSKTQSTTSTDQHKSTKNEGFYKAKKKVNNKWTKFLKKSKIKHNILKFVK